MSSGEWAMLIGGVVTSLLSLICTLFVAKIKGDVREVKLTLLAEIRLLKAALRVLRRDARQLDLRVGRHSERLDVHGKRLQAVETKVA